MTDGRQKRHGPAAWILDAWRTDPTGVVVCAVSTVVLAALMMLAYAKIPLPS